MPTFKTIFYFENLKNGWSETFYQTATNSSTAFDNAFVLLKKRTMMMAQPTIATFIRISDEGIARSAELTAVGPSTMFPYPTQSYASFSDRVTSAVLFRAFGSPLGTNRPIYVRGNPDNLYDLVTPGNTDATTWQTNANAWLAILKNPAAQWLIKHRTPRSSILLSAIYTWVNEAPASPNSVFTTDKPTGLAIGDFLQIYGPAGLKPKASLFKVQNVSEASANASVTVYYNLPNNFLYSGGARWGKYVPGYGNITDVQREQFVTRATGRPFAGTRGRRRSIHP